MAASLTARLRRPHLVTEYARELRVLPTRATRVAAVVLALVYLLTPNVLSDFWLSVLIFAGIFAVGALGLNLLVGYTGQVSLGHAFFMAIGAYVASEFGAKHGWPIVLWLPVAAAIGGVVGGLVGPFALRLKGNYLAIVSVGLVLIGLHIWTNWHSLTGGSAGVGGAAKVAVGPLDFNHLSIGAQSYSRNQSWFWLVWGIAAAAGLIAKNIVRTRPGRAMQAVRDRDVAAAVIGVELARTKVGAFVVSSAFASVAGGLYFAFVQYVSPAEWDLLRSIQFIAIIIVGGVGTIFGSFVGALFIGGAPRLVEAYSKDIPLITHFGLSINQLNQLLFGLVIIIFLVAEPRGLAGLWFRAKAYFKAWPFSY